MAVQLEVAKLCELIASAGSECVGDRRPVAIDRDLGEPIEHSDRYQSRRCQDRPGPGHCRDQPELLYRPARGLRTATRAARGPKVGVNRCQGAALGSMD